MLTAITRLPGPELNRCQLSHLDRQPIDFGRALTQHRGYRDALRDAGVTVIELAAAADQPDGVFVEDTAVILDEIAVITCPAPLPRRSEVTAVNAALQGLYPVSQLPPGMFLEGGDVLRLGRTLYVGLSARTGPSGLHALEAVAGPLGYRIVPVPVRGCLHLKSACCGLDDETLLVNRDWVDTEPLAKLRLIDVPPEEPWAANVLRLPGSVVVSGSYPRTAELVRRRGCETVVLDVSELHKAEAGLTCMSLLFEAQPK